MWPTTQSFDRDGIGLGVVTLGHEGITTTVERRLKLSLIVGFIAFFGAVVTAYTAPANGYELSIYAGTPLSFWILWGIAMTVSLSICAYAPRTGWGLYALLLGGVGAFSIPALPLLRGYYFYGVGDSLSHLGWARSIAADVSQTWDLVYPLGHVLSVLLSQLGGTTLPHSMMRTVLVFVGLYFVGIPLVIRTLVDDRRAVILAAFSAFLLLPVNTISTYLHFHPFSMAMLYFPIVLLMLVRYLAQDTAEMDSPVTTNGLLLLGVGFGYVFFHPQTALNAIILFIAIATLQSWYRWREPDDRIGRSPHQLVRSPRIHGHVVLLVLAFFAWNSQHWQMFMSVESTIDALFKTLAGEAQAGEVVRTTSASAEKIGFSPLEIFGKLFLVESLYGLLAAGLVLRYLLSPRRSQRERLLAPESAITYLSFGGLVLTPFFLLQFLGAVSSYFFRHIGFGFVLVTVLGALSLYSLLDVVSSPSTKRIVQVAAVTIGLSLLALSIIAMFQSPFMYKATQHADEQQMQGWKTSFIEQPPSPSNAEGGPVWYGTARRPVIRYKTALQSAPGTPWYPGPVEPFPIPSGPVNESQIRGGLIEHYQTHPEEIVRRDHYFVISAMTKEQNIVAYGELRYSAESFRMIGAQRGIHRIHANGGYTVYYVDLPAWKPLEETDGGDRGRVSNAVSDRVSAHRTKG